MKIIILLLVLFSFTNSVLSQSKKTPDKQNSKLSVPATAKTFLKNNLDSLSYAIGMSIGSNMRAQGIEKLNYSTLNKAIADALKENTTPLMNQDQCNMTIQLKLQEIAANKNFAVKEEGRKFLAENKKQPGVVELPSGVQYKIITQGTGVKPLLEDTIVAHYRGTTLDGNVFDESYGRGEPIIYPLNKLVSGWQQTVVLMPVGSKWQLFIPSDFAYGDTPPPGIPGGATLIFEMELLDVKPFKKQ